MIRVGYADVDITPAIGGSMPGYFRDRIATGVLDPLLAKVLVLASSSATLGIVALDLIGLQLPEVDEIREAIQSKIGIPPGNVFVHSTHTHTGAMVPKRFTSDADELYPNLYPGAVDRNWVRQAPQKIASAAEKALANQTEEPSTTLSFGWEDSIAFYRRYLMKDGTIRTNPGRGNPNVVRPAGEIDPSVYVLGFETSKILLVSYGLHPDCVGGTQYSADYPFHLTEGIRESLGKDWNVVFLNAVCGNINHVDVRNPRQRSGYEESRRIGRKLADTVLAARGRSQHIDLEPLRARTRIVQCSLRKVPPDVAERAEREVKENVDMTARNFNELFAPAAYVLSKTKDRNHPAEIIALQLGPLALVGLPAEVFVEIGRQVKHDSPFEPTLVIGLTGGAMGYMPHPKGYAEGGYEAGYRSARYAPSTPTLWIETAVELLREVGGRD